VRSEDGGEESQPLDGTRPTDLNDSIKDDQFEIIQIPTNWAHEGAVISVDQLRDRYNSVPILAGRQIRVGWLRRSGHR
jgi:hypothetical protein